MELTELTGEHTLDGVDVLSLDDGAGAICFRLDGITYVASEDPDDGYRSMLKDIVETDDDPKNLFPPQKVVGRMSAASILSLVDATTGRTVIEVGTNEDEDYYPTFVSSFTPEAMAINSRKGTQMVKLVKQWCASDGRCFDSRDEAEQYEQEVADDKLAAEVSTCIFNGRVDFTEDMKEHVMVALFENYTVTPIEQKGTS